MYKSFTFFLLFLSVQISYGQITIKMKRTGGVHEIPCKVNGLELSFIFDTGASSVSISLTEALYMFKNGQLSKTDVVGQQSFSTADGSISEGTKIILRSIEIAGMQLQNVEASVVHQLNAPLLLGQSAIEKLGKIQLDLANNTLTILNPSFKPANFDYSDKNFERSRRASQDIATSNISFQFIENPQNINFTQMGSVKVFTNAPIYETPEMKSGVIRFAKNNKVDVLSRVNDMCYKVRSENIEGYLWAGWFAY